MTILAVALPPGKTPRSSEGGVREDNFRGEIHGYPFSALSVRGPHAFPRGLEAKVAVRLAQARPAQARPGQHQGGAALQRCINDLPMTAASAAAVLALHSSGAVTSTSGAEARISEHMDCRPEGLLHPLQASFTLEKGKFHPVKTSPIFFTTLPGNAVPRTAGFRYAPRPVEPLARQSYPLGPSSAVDPHPQRA